MAPEIMKSLGNPADFDTPSSGFKAFPARPDEAGVSAVVGMFVEKDVSPDSEYPADDLRELSPAAMDRPEIPEYGANEGTEYTAAAQGISSPDYVDPDHVIGLRARLYYLRKRARVWATKIQNASPDDDISGYITGLQNVLAQEKALLNGRYPHGLRGMVGLYYGMPEIKKAHDGMAIPRVRFLERAVEAQDAHGEMETSATEYAMDGYRQAMVGLVLLIIGGLTFRAASTATVGIPEMVVVVACIAVLLWEVFDRWQRGQL